MMHHHSFLGKTVCLLAWLLCSLAAIFIGLSAFNIEVGSLNFVQMHLAAYMKYIKIVFGVAGVISLVALFCKCHHCITHKGNGSCCSTEKHK